MDKFIILLKGKSVLSRKIPATTTVLEWSTAKMGVGTSVAEGSHEWRPNWVDFPVAANTSPIRGRFE